MKRRLSLLFCLILTLSLAACGPHETAQPQDDTLTLTAVTYPVYLFAKEVTRGAEGVEVALMINQSVSCLHDYTLSVQDMKMLERADVVLLNGAGFEDAMHDVLDAAGKPQIACADGLDLLASTHEHDHDHSHSHDAEPSQETTEAQDGSVAREEADGEAAPADAHVWMDPMRACEMLHTLAHGLGELDPVNAALYEANAESAIAEVTAAYEALVPLLADLDCPYLITFHDGFTYFAEAFGLTVLRSIEEEAGSEASAKDVIEILEEMAVHTVPAIFTEINGSDATAGVIHRETGVPIYALSMLMSGDTEGVGIQTYLDGITANVLTIQEAYT